MPASILITSKKKQKKSNQCNQCHFFGLCSKHASLNTNENMYYTIIFWQINFYDITNFRIFCGWSFGFKIRSSAIFGVDFFRFTLKSITFHNLSYSLKIETIFVYLALKFFWRVINLYNFIVDYQFGYILYLIQSTEKCQ